MASRKKRQTYYFAYDVQKVLPLPKYFEEIFAYTKGMPKMGIRGDKYFIFYSKDGLGRAYFEGNENTKSAQATYEYFSKERNSKAYFKVVDALENQISDFVDSINRKDLTKLSDKELKVLFFEAYDLTGEAFKYFLATQTYRFVAFEENLRRELKKRVAASRVDMYMIQLAVSEKPTQMSKEELDWVSLIIKYYKTSLPRNLTIESLKSTNPALANAIKNHFIKYRTLTLGDGVWTYDINYFLRNFKRDIKKPLAQLRQRQQELRAFSNKTLKEREQIIKELYLDTQTIELIEFLADVGHSRFNQRTNGWMPLVFTSIRLEIELVERMPRGYLDNSMFLTNAKEMKGYINRQGKITPEDLSRRRGRHEEFLVYLNNGKHEVYFGPVAGRMFEKLVPPVDYAKTTEVKGVVAMSGKVKGRVSLFLSGDDMSKKLRTIKKNGILVTGNTRPAMMPLIREARGIVTDEGGITSHAAIVSRELGLPSIINTRTATKVFKEGDLVELDTERGIVRKII